MRGPLELFRESWNVTKENIVLLGSIYLVPVIATILLGVITEILLVEDGRGAISFTSLEPVSMIGTLLIALLLIVISVSGSIALIRAIIAPKENTVKSAYQYGFRHILGFLWLSFLVGIATMLGFIFFIIPGIILSVWFVFTQFIFVNEDVRGTAAMRKSREYARGKWWKIFGRLMALAGLTILVYVPFSLLGEILVPETQSPLLEIFINLLGVVVVPFSFVYLYLLYKDASGKAEMVSTPVSSTDGANA